jgi:hypothetical protein
MKLCYSSAPVKIPFAIAMDQHSHQRDGETNIQAGSRRLFEEMVLIQNSKSFFILFIKLLLIMV